MILTACKPRCCLALTKLAVLFTQSSHLGHSSKREDKDESPSHRSLAKHHVSVHSHLVSNLCISAACEPVKMRTSRKPQIVELATLSHSALAHKATELFHIRPSASCAGYSHLTGLVERLSIFRKLGYEHVCTAPTHVQWVPCCLQTCLTASSLNSSIHQHQLIA